MSNDLRKMIQAVEEGTLDAWACGAYGHFLVPYCNGKTITLVTPLNAFHGSVDAAIALCETLLPGWKWEINSAGQVARVFRDGLMDDTSIWAVNPILSRASCSPCCGPS